MSQKPTILDTGIQESSDLNQNPHAPSPFAAQAAAGAARELVPVSRVSGALLRNVVLDSRTGFMKILRLERGFSVRDL